MATPAQKKRLGAFLLLLLVAGVVGIGTLIWQHVRNPKDRYFVRFRESVSGLEVGTTVKMRGVAVGQVERVAIGSDGESVIVTLALQPGTPVPTDTGALLSAIGVTGLKFVELTGGTGAAPRIPPNTERSIIQAGESTLATFRGRASTIAYKMDLAQRNVARLTGEEVRGRVRRLQKNARRLVDTVEGLDRGRWQRILKRVDRTTKSLDRASVVVNKLMDENRGLADQTRGSLTAAAESVERILKRLRPEASMAAVERALDAASRRMDTLGLAGTARSLEATAARAAALAEQLGKSMELRSAEWDRVKEHLRRAGFFLRELAGRFSK
jgi:phospholipid/cholesterol/gamma-HCH transport system substrate-binding protein